MQSACAVLSSVTCLALSHFSTLSNKRHDFREKASGYKLCVLNFSTIFVLNFSRFKKNRAEHYRECMYVCIQVKCPLFCRFLMEL